MLLKLLGIDGQTWQPKGQWKEQILGIWPEKYEDLEGPLTYNKEDDQSAKLLNAEKDKEGWWITEDD
ncbi:hypothetical protein QYF61_005694 [Mycteria americana]|uniref:Uncharacterized protein n=1 Tax=Mycteria americana TaxID=33587 RepID=A0AAN7S2D0_MYCAM|nr:hypothetical protein QYF61_005694 [Mycteria americana]